MTSLFLCIYSRLNSKVFYVSISLKTSTRARDCFFHVIAEQIVHGLQYVSSPVSIRAGRERTTRPMLIGKFILCVQRVQEVEEVCKILILKTIKDNLQHRFSKKKCFVGYANCCLLLKINLPQPIHNLQKCAVVSCRRTRHINKWGRDSVFHPFGGNHFLKTSCSSFWFEAHSNSFTQLLLERKHSEC